MKESKSVSLFLIIFLGLLTAVTPLATDMYLPALSLAPFSVTLVGRPLCIKIFLGWMRNNLVTRLFLHDASRYYVSYRGDRRLHIRRFLWG